MRKNASTAQPLKGGKIWRNLKRTSKAQDAVNSDIGYCAMSSHTLARAVEYRAARSCPFTTRDPETGTEYKGALFPPLPAPCASPHHIVRHHPGNARSPDILSPAQSFRTDRACRIVGPLTAPAVFDPAPYCNCQHAQRPRPQRAGHAQMLNQGSC